MATPTAPAKTYRSSRLEGEGFGFPEMRYLPQVWLRACTIQADLGDKGDDGRWRILTTVFALAEQR